MFLSKGHGTQPLEAPSLIPHLGIPITENTVEVRIINTTTYQKSRTENLYGTALTGHETLNFPSYAFLITNKKDKIHLLFDLGMRHDWRKSCPPELQQYVSTDDPRAPLQVNVQTDVAAILDADAGELGITSRQISAVVWSHHHFDHRGDMSRFPPYTKLITGPGLLSTYGHELSSDDVGGRDVIELSPSDFALQIGGFAAHDAFSDGSLYLLNCPGHTVGHMAALARLTTEPHCTYALLGGDCAHHCGEFRPSPYAPLPQQLSFKSAHHAFDKFGPASPKSPSMLQRKPMVCAGEFIQDVIHPKKSCTDPFYETPKEPIVHSHQNAKDSLNKLEVFDADEDVLVCISHDASLMSTLPFYPSMINNWYRRRYKQRLKWEFLNDFDLSGNSIRRGRKLY